VYKEINERKEEKENLKMLAKYWNNKISLIDGDKVNLSLLLDELLEEIEENRNRCFGMVPDINKKVVERARLESFQSELGNQEEVKKAYGWKMLGNQWKNQIRSYNLTLTLKTIHIEGQKAHKFKFQIVIKDGKEIFYTKLGEGDTREDILIKLIAKWGLKPKKHYKFRFREKKSSENL
jgi:hypothetical protein